MTAAIILTPTQGPNGQVVTITGTGFTGTDAITVTFAGVSIVTSPASPTCVGGAFSCTITVPSGLVGSVAGAHAVVATDAHSVTGSANFTITPQTTVDPTYGPAGATVVVTGSGFAATSAVTFLLDGNSITATGSITTDANGAFTATINLPNTLANGNHTLTSTDASSNTANSTYIVSNTLPFTKVVKNNIPIEYVENLALVISDSNMVDQAVIDTRYNNQLQLTIYNDGNNGLTYSTFGIIHESDANIPATDPTTGIKKWTAIDSNVAVANGANSAKNYTGILYSYILIQMKETSGGSATTAKLSARRPTVI